MRSGCGALFISNRSHVLHRIVKRSKFVSRAGFVQFHLSGVEILCGAWYNTSCFAGVCRLFCDRLLGTRLSKYLSILIIVEWAKLLLSFWKTHANGYLVSRNS
jgi:hypothetical protein